MGVHCPLFHLITDKSIPNFNFWTDKILKTLSANLIKIKLMVTIWSVFLCLKYVTNPLVNLFIIFFKKQMYQFTQKKISNVLKTTDLSLYSQTLAVASILFVPLCSHIFQKTTLYLEGCLDISKSFNRVWQQRNIHKCKGILGNYWAF